MTEEINPGDVRTVTISFATVSAEGTRTPADPETVTLKWRVFSDDDLTTWVYGTDAQVHKDGVGEYSADIPIAVAGNHSYRWESTGAVVTAEEGSFRAVTRF